jgi:hypothetical protein
MSQSDQHAVPAAQMRAAPPRVKSASNWASALGLVTTLWMCVWAYDGGETLGKGLVARFIFFALLWYNGMTLLRRSRAGFVVLSLLAAYLAFCGIMAVVRSFRLPAEAMGGASYVWLIAGMGTGVISVSGILFRYLFSTETRRYVWAKPGEEALTTEPTRERSPS